MAIRFFPAFSAPFAALLRSDLNSFIRKSFTTIFPGTPYLPNWHIDAIVYQLMRVHRGEVSRLLINQPPRSLKSICVSVAYVAWLLGHDPARRIIVVSYSNEFAAELHRQFRMLIDAPWYRALFPSMRPAKDSGTELVTTAGGSRYATSVVVSRKAFPATSTAVVLVSGKGDLKAGDRLFRATVRAPWRARECASCSCRSHRCRSQHSATARVSRDEEPAREKTMT